MKTVLFLCTGNSCRSRIAEALVNARLSSKWRAFSAGTRPTGYVHPMALAALAEIGIEHHGHSKSVDEFRQHTFDLVITVCDNAVEECPLWLGPGRKLHIGFPDPAKASGTDEEIMAVFRQVRDAIAIQILPLLDQA